MRKVGWLALLLLSACGASAASPEGASETRWLGIPFASAERWTLPKLNADWEDAAPFDAMGAPCPQRGQAVMTEDCLFLNVFAPEEARNAPVMVWIHGGGFISGFGGDGPAAFTQDGFVVVTFNYRLGQLGFHDWPGWGEDDPRNFGQADMVAALQWVQANIARFGGDPDDVTLMGHSAGGMGVQLMMVDARADGLFDKAWSHAGYGSWPFPKAYNPTEEERARIRYRALRTDAAPGTLVDELSAYHLPFTDAPHLRVQPDRLIGGSPEAFVAGANSFDGAGTLRGAGFTPDTLLSRIDSPDLRAAYADDFAVSEERAAQRIFGDMRYLQSSIKASQAVAEGGNPGSYLFVYDDAQNGAPGAFHGQQYDGVFGGTASDYRDALVRFALTGDPGWPGVGMGKYAVFRPELNVEDTSQLAARSAVLARALEAIANE